MNGTRNAAMWGSVDTRQRHAVVIGGSFAGLLAAKVLTGFAGRVTLIERDRFPQGPEARPGVPQGRHPHVLLEGGQHALDTLLPGFMDALRETGAPRVGMPSDLVQWQDGRWLRRMPPSMHIYTGSRVRLEHLLRRRVLADRAITVIEGAQVTGLSGDATRVRGVLLRERGNDTGRTERQLPADLVVDAAGRGTKAAQWLSALGAEAAPEETIDAGIAYATRIYRDTTGTLGTDPLGFYVLMNPTQPYAGLLLPMEGGRYTASLVGLPGDLPPTDEDEFVAYAKKLPHPFVHQWLTANEPLSPVFGFRQTANVRRRYDLPGPRPAGFLAVGDALCTFNPVYGQGVAVAAMGGLALRDALADRRRTPSTRRVQRALLAVSRQAWDIAAGADKAMPGATGNALATRAADRAAGWYLRRIQDRYPGDPVVGAAFRSVLSFTSPITALLAPRVLARTVLRPVPPTPVEPPMVREKAGA